jgi:hypothetical protein
MLRLTERDLRVWADEQGISDLLFAELDYRLAKTLEEFYRDGFLSKRLCLKGGTAINKDNRREEKDSTDTIGVRGAALARAMFGSSLFRILAVSGRL